jgi:uncharacterized protein YndB with AHSA1/START domain
MGNVVARVEMAIRRPPNEVFDAFVQPRTLEKFWLRHASGPLAKDAVVAWEFLVDGARETVTVTEFVEYDVIAFTWSDGIAVTIHFSRHDDSGTTISVSATGFQGEDAAAHAMNATEGFAIVVCDLKCLLETGRSGNMVRDKAALISANMARETRDQSSPR